MKSVNVNMSVINVGRDIVYSISTRNGGNVKISAINVGRYIVNVYLYILKIYSLYTASKTHDIKQLHVNVNVNNFVY